MENRIDLEWNTLMHDFKEYLIFLGDKKSTSNKSYKPESMASYVSYINSLNKANGGQTVKWLSEALNAEDPSKVLLEKLQNLKCDNAAKTISNWKSAIFCPQYIYEKVKSGELGSQDYKAPNDYGSWYSCKYRRKKSGEVKGSCVDNQLVKLDDNTYANKAVS